MHKSAAAISLLMMYVRYSSLHSPPIFRLLSGLERFTVQTDFNSLEGKPDTFRQVLGMLESCKGLTSFGFASGYSPFTLDPSQNSTITATLTEVTMLTQLRTISVEKNMHCRDLAPLSSLPLLECLCIGSLTGPDAGVKLHRMHTL